MTTEIEVVDLSPITVADLIRKLQSFPPETVVVFHDEDGCFFPFANIDLDGTCNDDEEVVRVCLCDDEDYEG